LHYFTEDWEDSSQYQGMRAGDRGSVSKEHN
jgi:hypothetical protein